MLSAYTPLKKKENRRGALCSKSATFRFYGIIGEATVNFISQFRLDFGILGISAIDLDGSLLDYDYHEVQVKRAIIESSRQTLLATDHSKFSRQAIVRLGELKDVDYLFTDDVPKQIADYLENSNTKLVICK